MKKNVPKDMLVFILIVAVIFVMEVIRQAVNFHLFEKWSIKKSLIQPPNRESY